MFRMVMEMIKPNKNTSLTHENTILKPIVLILCRRQNSSALSLPIKRSTESDNKENVK